MATKPYNKQASMNKYIIMFIKSPNLQYATKWRLAVPTRETRDPIKT